MSVLNVRPAVASPVPTGYDSKTGINWKTGSNFRQKLCVNGTWKRLVRVPLSPKENFFQKNVCLNSKRKLFSKECMS